MAHQISQQFICKIPKYLIHGKNILKKINLTNNSKFILLKDKIIVMK